jgi:hypothetical protein
MKFFPSIIKMSFVVVKLDKEGNDIFWVYKKQRVGLIYTVRDKIGCRYFIHGGPRVS